MRSQLRCETLVSVEKFGALLLKGDFTLEAQSQTAKKHALNFW